MIVGPDPRLSLFVGDENRLVVSTSPGHMALLGRRRDDVLGHDWRAWVHKDDVGRADALTSRALGGNEPISLVRRLHMPNGSEVLAQVTAMPVHVGGKTVLFCANRAVLNATDAMLALDGAETMASYVEDLTAGLSAMTAEKGLVELSDSLQDIAGRAAEITRWFARMRQKIGFQ